MGYDFQADRKDKAKRLKRKAAEKAKSDSKAKKKMASQKVCTQCGEIRKPIVVTPGSILIEIILWLCFLIPGLIYSIWRMVSKKKNCCPDCRTPTMVSAQSRIGNKILD